MQDAGRGVEKASLGGQVQVVVEDKSVQPEHGACGRTGGVADVGVGGEGE